MSIMFVACILASCISSIFSNKPPIHGRYTRSVIDYQLVVPRKLNQNGDFASFHLPHFYHDSVQGKGKRATERNDVNYGVTFDGFHRYLELEPNYGFLSPEMAIESYNPNRRVHSRLVKRRKEKQCYYVGKLKDIINSRVAISTCNGLVGYITMNGSRYFIEPVAEHTPNESGQLLHLVYRQSGSPLDKRKEGPTCGTDGNWEEAWKERLYREYRNDADHHRKLKRGLTSTHRYLETLVVADKKFMEYHKDSDYETYLLTVMNMVSDFYHDASAGNQMDVVVVRVIYLEKEEEEIDLTIGQHAENTLATFCKWQERINPKDIAHPNHHDIAVLITRYDICSDNMKNCGLMGLAYVATACTGDKPCAINEDSGLTLGIVVAHEMGHVMGCSHDIENESGCRSQASDESFHIMAPYVHMHTSRWSSCSKTFITTFFDNDLGECLNDEPQESIYKETNMPPGAMYDAEYQCNLEFPGSKVCGGDPETFCNQLLCQTTPTTCMSNGEPPADGTHCGANKWCYQKKCVEIGQRPKAVNGGWGEFGNWSDCSRTCGGGIMFSERDCNNPTPANKGRYCLGERKKVKTCNIHPCAEGAAGFRAVQCSAYNKTPFRGKLYQWKPFSKDDEPCVLYCVNDDKVYTKLAPRAKDGTPCKKGTRNMCISGVCRKIGCDFGIDSDAVDDICGVCKGDGTQCKLVDEIYVDPPGHGYVKVAILPQGSRNVEIEEEHPSDNTIAISAPDQKKFYLNGDFVEQGDGSHDMGGVEGVYSHPEPNKESLVISGPLKENLVFFVVYYTNENVGYHYKYAQPSPSSSYQPSYHWEFIEWGECSVRCGGGVESADPECLEEKAGKVHSSYCSQVEKPPPKTRICNEHPCLTKWRVSKWSKCSGCKFKSGVQTREVECVRQSSRAGTEDTLVEDKLCPTPKPGSTQMCNSQKTCACKPQTENAYLPSSMLEHVWLQTLNEFGIHPTLKYEETLENPEKLQSARTRFLKEIKDREGCGHANKSKTNSKPFKIGATAKDHVPAEAIRLIEVPIKHSHLALNLSDEAFEQMGDKVGDTVDSCKKKELTGEKAAEMLKHLQHNNVSRSL